jgi:hypothetical protein
MAHNMETLRQQQEGLAAAQEICGDLSANDDIVLAPVKYFDHIKQMESDGKKFMTGFRMTSDIPCSIQEA